MTAGQATAFLLFAVVAAGTPGPSNLILASTGAKVGLPRGLPSLAGQVVGMGLMLFLVAMGLGSVILTSPGLVLGLKVVGVGFLLWLAWKIATAHRSARDAATDKRLLGFWGMAAFQWISPKSWLVSISAASVYLHRGAGTPFTQAAAFGLLFILVALPCCFIWLAFGASLQRLLHADRTARIFNMAMGVLLAGAVVLFIW